MDLILRNKFYIIQADNIFRGMFFHVPVLTPYDTPVGTMVWVKHMRAQASLSYHHFYTQSGMSFQSVWDIQVSRYRTLSSLNEQYTQTWSFINKINESYKQYKISIFYLFRLLILPDTCLEKTFGWLLLLLWSIRSVCCLLV